MVLESILEPKTAENEPLNVLFISFLYSLVSIFISLKLFTSQASILSIALITIVFVPFFQRLFEIEEEKDELEAEGRINMGLWERHSSVITTYSAFFMGVILAFSFVFIFFPSNDVFSLQIDWFKGQGVVGGEAAIESVFTKYILNNTQVMILIFILSIMFGAGAILILAWNASIISVYLGLIIHELMATGMETHTAYLFGIPLGLSTIIIHGIPEIMAYFIAAMAGGIFSVGILREKIISPELKEVFRDSMIFLFVAQTLIILAAWLEAYW